MSDPGPRDENADYLERVEIPWWAAWPLLLAGFAVGLVVGMAVGWLA